MGDCAPGRPRNMHMEQCVLLGSLADFYEHCICVNIAPWPHRHTFKHAISKHILRSPAHLLSRTHDFAAPMAF